VLDKRETNERRKRLLIEFSMKSLYLCVLCLGVGGLGVAQELERGIEMYRKNDFAQAAATLRPYVEKNPGNARANLYLGLALVEQGKVDDGAQFLVKADEMEPGGESKAGMARLYVEQKNYEKADEALADASGEEVPYVRGLLELNRKQFEDAARDLESYSQSHPNSAYAHYYAGMAYNGAKRPDKMLTHFEIFIKMKPDAPEARKVQSVLRAVK